MNKQYADRNPMELDKAGGYSIRHLFAMTSEKLHGKSEIAEELGYRDMVIDDLIRALDKAAIAFGGIESYFDEQWAHETAKINGEFKEMCLDAISKARGMYE